MRGLLQTVAYQSTDAADFLVQYAMQSLPALSAPPLPVGAAWAI